MKKKNWLLLVLIVLCLGVFYSYRAIVRARTDTQPPVITINPEPVEISVNAPKGILLQDVTAEDDVDGDVTDSIIMESIHLLDSDGRISVGYAAFDSAGNVAKLQREARYTNYRSPRFTLSGPLVYTFGQNFDVLNTIGAVDCIDGDIQHHVRATLTENTPITEIGTHMVQFRVTNSLGDTTTEIFPVEVYSSDTYNGTLTLKEYLIYLPVGGKFTPKFYPDTFTYRREDHELDNITLADYTLEINGDVDTNTPGVYPVEYKITYSEVNQRTQKVTEEYTGYSKLIVIVEG